MSDTIPSTQLEASTSTNPDAAATRTTGRTRVKSQRVLEAEETKQYLLKQAHAHTQAQGTASAEPPASKPVSNTKKGKGKKKVEDQVYCICKTDNEGPMIECGECNDWFHFTCIGLTDDEAEKIHKYDLSTFPSPSPPLGVVPAKRKVKSKIRKATPSQTSDDETNSDAEAEIGQAQSSSRHSSAQPTPPPQNKKPRPSIDATSKRKPSVTVDRKTSIDRKPSTAGVGLPPVRKYVREKFVPLFQKVFGSDTSQQEIERFSAEVEDGIYGNFKDLVNGKEIAGTRYKTQFNLLSSSIARGLRQDLIQSITSHTLTPLQIATLTSADLASDEQLAAIQRAKQSVLEQHVKSKSDLEPSSSIRLGRDGFEKVENVHEKEMSLIAQQEESARLKVEEEKRKELEMANNPNPEPAHSPVTKDQPKFKMNHRKSESIDAALPSPLRQSSFANVSSAWNSNVDNEPGAHKEEVSNVDQSNLDLSDIVGDIEMELDDILVEQPKEVEKSEMEVFESKEIVWSGGIVNPANPSTIVPPMSLRLTCRTSSSSLLDWNVLLPHKTIEITGRVPTKNSLQFLSDSRLNPAKELITVAFSLDAKATDEEILTWEEMVDYHISRDRHAIYLPYGSHPPSGAAKELYLIPLRPQDPSPEFTELIDGYSLPSKGRSTSVFLGIFICIKMTTPTPIASQSHTLQQPPSQTIPTPTAAAVTTTPMIQNDQLQALMASLNPATLQNLVGGITPPMLPPGGSTPPIGGTTPMAYVPQAPQPPQQYSPYPQQGYSPYPPSGGFTPQPQGYAPDPREGGRRDSGGGGRDPRRRDRERDNGWGNRGRDGNRRY
uniref:Transcription factor BYE1 n=1 Tax=Kwoniella bestiolae CBS 10118 TaxID=1296100 RepID=A0A1B9FYT5_9TREE|nr:hypothetical protein I302_06906 [Kwoniella bestiolae CBS 10118]OCF23920.1 hypothetical protein I302_06906 [Kwoniella bestiolae CBS 10118]